jgi:hypothetical protein
MRKARGLALTWSLALALVLGRGVAAHASPQPGAPHFEANQGQFEPGVRFVARGRSYALFLTPSGATLALQRTRGEARSVVSMTVKDAAAVEPRGTLALPGRSNYFVGSDTTRWRSGVESYARVRYESALPGVDVEYHGTEGHELEYDLLLAAGVSPLGLELDFGGVSRIELTANGQALLHLPDGSTLVKAAPVAYQERAGQRIAVSAKYELRGGGLGFSVGAYDRALPLVIDPVLTYATYFGGSSFDEAYGIAADAAGNTYIVGYTASTLFPTASPYQGSHAGGAYDAFVVKLDRAGQNIVYSTYLGGSGADIAYAVAVDALGNAYVAGLTTSANFPTQGALQGALAGSQDAFVTKLNAAGSALGYSTYLGGAQDDYAKGIAVSGAGAVYLTGTTFSTNFPKAAPLQGTLSGTQDAFATQIAPGGASLVYSTYLGGSANEYGYGIALDNAGNAYVVGSTTSPNFPTLNARQSSAGGAADAFLSKLNAAGSGFVFSTYLGGSSLDEALGVSVTLGTAIVVGYTFSTNFPVTFAAQEHPGGNNHRDAFITRFDPSGTALVYSTYLGGTGNDSASGVATDSFGNAYIVGQTDSSDLPVQSPLEGQSVLRGPGDAFVATVTATGSRFPYVTYLGGAAEDHGAGIAEVAGTTYVVGSTQSVDFPKLAPIINGLVGAQDAFIVKLPGIDTVGAPALTGFWLAWLCGLLLWLGSRSFTARAAARCQSAPRTGRP